MRKVKVLAVILVLSMMLTGAAYALWNQNITMSTTAAMGKMDVAVQCDPCVYPLSWMPGIDGWEEWYNTTTWKAAEPYMNGLNGDVTAGTGGHNFTVTVNEMYPGAKYGVNFTITNTGDVPVKLSQVIFTPTYNGELFSQLKGSFSFHYQSAYVGTILGFGDSGNRTVTVDADYLTTDGLGAAIVNVCKDIILYPGDQLIGCGDQDEVDTTMKVLVADTISGDQFENQTVKFDVAFNWQQVTPVYAPVV